MDAQNSKGFKTDNWVLSRMHEHLMGQNQHESVESDFVGSKRRTVNTMNDQAPEAPKKETTKWHQRRHHVHGQASHVGSMIRQSIQYI